MGTDTDDFEKACLGPENNIPTGSSFEDQVVLQEMRRIGASKVYKQQTQTHQVQRHAIYTTEFEFERDPSRTQSKTKDRSAEPSRDQQRNQ